MIEERKPASGGNETEFSRQVRTQAARKRTLFVGLAMIESVAIYCLVISMILIFANPFWNHAISLSIGK